MGGVRGHDKGSGPGPGIPVSLSEMLPRSDWRHCDAGIEDGMAVALGLMGRRETRHRWYTSFCAFLYVFNTISSDQLGQKVPSGRKCLLDEGARTEFPKF